jgi:biofilm protein TabA
MILDTLAHADRYAALHPLFPQAIEFMRGNDLKSLKPGRHPILGEDLFAIAESCAGRRRAEAQLECHRRYIDIQLVLEGTDEMGWKPIHDCVQPETDYSEAKDIRFFKDAPDAWIATRAHAFCIFFPEDAHAPLVSAGYIRKIIFKIAVNPTR